jgi:hypothetical protein
VALDPRSIWAILGVEPTNDEREVRRAYARRLKEVHPEDDAEGFQALREAYERALDMARRGWAVPAARRGSRKKKAETAVETPVSSGENWSNSDPERWIEPVDEGDPGNGWEDAHRQDWDVPPPAPQPELLPEILAELEAEKIRQAAHAALCDELDVLLRQKTVPSGDALSVMLKIFRSPAMDSLRVHANTEYWLAQAIARGGPAADALIEPAIRFFGWDDGRVGVDMSHAIPVLRRRDVARVIQQLARPMTVGHDAWKALRAKQPLFRRIADRLDPFLSRQVADLLSRAVHELPDLHGHLDPDAVAVWRARLARPRFSALFLLSLLIAPPILSLIVVTVGTFGPPTLLNFLAAWVVALAVLAGIGAAWVNGVLIPARKWATGYPWDAPLWKRLGWAPATVALLTVAPVFTGVDWLWSAILLAGLGIIAWTRIVTSHIHPPAPSRYRFAEFIGVAPIAFYVLFTPGSASQPSLIAAMISAAAAFRLGGHAIVQEWLSQGLDRQRQVSLALIGGAVAVGALAVLTAWIGVPGLALGLVCGFAFMDRALATHRFGLTFQLRRWWLMVGWFGALFVAGVAGAMDKSAPAAFAVWLVAAGVLTGITAFLPEAGQKSGKKRRPGQLA